MSQLKVNSIVPAGGIPAGASGGGIIQTVSTTKTDSFSTTSTSYVDITGLSATITPSSSSSKILIMSQIQMGQSAGNRGAMFQIVRGATAIGLGDANGIRTRCTGAGYDAGADINGAPIAHLSYLDSPSTTSATTYKIQMLGFSFNTNITMYINIGGQNQTYNPTAISTITLMEISG